MSLPTISPKDAKRLMDAGAVLIDIRGPDEFARERIAGARNRSIEGLGPIDSAGKPVIFHCKSGNRTAVNAAKLAAATTCETYVVEGGIEAWKDAGLPVVVDRKQPIEIQRQMQMTAGALVLIGVILSRLVDPAFIGLSAFVGAGLMFAGITGWCGMIKLLAMMPWNQRAAKAP